jgi:hypothetical protein
MNNIEINYQEKLRNFQAMTDNHIDATALDYLQKSNWDETVNNR